MKRLKNVLDVVKYPILLVVLEFFIMSLFVLFFKGTDKIDLANYLNNNKLYISVILFIIMFSILRKKVNLSKPKFKLNDIFLILGFGISLSLIVNLILFNLNRIYYFTNMFDTNNNSLIISIICTGVLGPILEELVFRGYVYTKLKKIVKPMSAIIYTSVLFAVMHGILVQILYTFGLSFMLIYVLEKYKSIYAPIVIHMTFNITSLVLLPLFLTNNVLMNTILLVLVLIIFIIFYKLMYKE